MIMRIVIYQLLIVTCHNLFLKPLTETQYFHKGAFARALFPDNDIETAQIYLSGSAKGPTFLISIDAILRFVCEQKYKIYDCQQIYCHISYLNSMNGAFP